MTHSGCQAGRQPHRPLGKTRHPARLPGDGSDSAREPCVSPTGAAAPERPGEESLSLPSQGPPRGQPTQHERSGSLGCGRPWARLPIASSDAEGPTVPTPRPHSPAPLPAPRARSPLAAPQLSATQNGARRPQDFMACGVILAIGPARAQSPALPAPSPGHGRAGAAGTVPARFCKQDPGGRAAGERRARPGGAPQRDYMARRRELCAAGQCHA